MYEYVNMFICAAHGVWLAVRVGVVVGGARPSSSSSFSSFPSSLASLLGGLICVYRRTGASTG
jgi:hypothetical protein